MGKEKRQHKHSDVTKIVKEEIWNLVAIEKLWVNEIHVNAEFSQQQFSCSCSSERKKKMPNFRPFSLFILVLLLFERWKGTKRLQIIRQWFAENRRDATSWLVGAEIYWRLLNFPPWPTFVFHRAHGRLLVFAAARILFGDLIRAVDCVEWRQR